MAEVPFVFHSGLSELVGLIHHPQKPAATGVLIVVGGPQYRVGSHRQFVLLARFLCDCGYAVMRFDYTGMGDSEGPEADFENIDADIQTAIGRFYARTPGLERIVIWGLCDAASAALFYSSKDKRVVSQILLNPWVRTEEGMARAYLKHYYLQRLLEKSFWKKLLSGRFNPRASLASLLHLAARSRGDEKMSRESIQATEIKPLPERMADGLEAFTGRVLFILSGNNDYVADEFRDLVAASRRWRRLMKRDRVQVSSIPEANHTFSRSDWRQKVEHLTADWLRETENGDTQRGGPVS